MILRFGSPTLDCWRYLGVPGEDLPKVLTHEMENAAELEGKKVLVIGGRHPPIWTARKLVEKAGAAVTLSCSRKEFSSSMNREVEAIAELGKTGQMIVILNSSVTEIRENNVRLRVGEEERELENDVVLICTEEADWLEKFGINIVTVKETRNYLSEPDF